MHDHRGVYTLGREIRRCIRGIRDQLGFGLNAVLRVEGPFCALHQVPESGRAGGVGDQVDACDARGVDDRMLPPVVKGPDLASGHVDLPSVAAESDRGVGNNRDVHPQMIVPVIVDIAVLGYLRLGAQAHQARAADDGVERCKHLLDVGTSCQFVGGHHGTLHVVVLVAMRRHQDHRGIALVRLRVGAPLFLRKAGYFLDQAVNIVAQREFVEFGFQLHVTLDQSRPSGRPNAKTRTT